MKARNLILALGVLMAVGATAAKDRHFALTRSVPAADATVTSPAEVRLWFSEPATESSVSIRVTNAGGDAVETSAVTRDEADAKVYAVAVPRPLGAGRYTVAWRGIGDDGHVVTGDFAFTVRAAE
ncbi:MAG: copper resistance protein CopC [Gemmatimonadales bacterium]